MGKPKTQGNLPTTQIVHNVHKKRIKYGGKTHTVLTATVRLNDGTFKDDFINYDFNDPKTQEFLKQMVLIDYKNWLGTSYNLEITLDEYPKIVNIEQTGVFVK